MLAACAPVESRQTCAAWSAANQIAVPRQRVEARRQVGLPDRVADDAVQAVSAAALRRRGVDDPGEVRPPGAVEDWP